MPPGQSQAVRKPIIILLLSSFLLQAGGLWLLMYSRQMALKREMKSRLRFNPNQFDQVVFEFELVKGEPVASSFEWEEEEDEFRYNGSIYDVIDKKITGNILQLRCIDDKKEADIIKKMGDLKKSEQGSNKSGLIPIQQLLSLLLFYQHNGYEPANLISSLYHIDHYSDSFNMIIIDIVAPPPRKGSLLNC